jgi:hypothetical protein
VVDRLLGHDAGQVIEVAEQVGGTVLAAEGEGIVDATHDVHAVDVGEALQHDGGDLAGADDDDP